LKHFEKEYVDNSIIEFNNNIDKYNEQRRKSVQNIYFFNNAKTKQDTIDIQRI